MMGMMSRIERVTVYREGARVTRVMALAEVAKEARFSGLPLTLDDGSVRARITGKDGLAVDVRVSLEVPDADASLAPAEDAALENARRAAETCRADVVRLKEALARLDALKITPRPQPRENETPLPIPLESRQKLLALRTSEEQRVAAALNAAHAAARVADAKLVDAQDHAKRSSAARNAKEHELRKVAVVSLANANAGMNVELEYMVPHARWSPSYVLTLSGAKAKLGMRALVAQRSGEDWAGARLELSTADSGAWVELPELAKARIGRAQPRPHKAGYRAPPDGARALYADYDRIAGEPSLPPPPPAQASVAAAEEETTLAFKLAEAPAGMAGFPMSAPMSRASPRKGGGAVTAVGAALAAPAMMLAGAIARAAAPQPQPAQQAPRNHGAVAKSAPADMLAEYGADEGVTQTRLPELAADWESAGESLAYGQLRMRGPNDVARGELTAVALASVYLEALGTRVKVDVAAAIRIAFDHAHVDESALPEGYELAHTDDNYDYLYAADLPCDVASDGAFHAIPVADWEATTNVRYVAVPREAQQVYRLLEIESPIDAALLSGPLDIYEGAGDDVMYRTTTRMPATPPRARVEIGLGVEPAVKIARISTFQEETAGLLGGSLALGHSLSVELRNMLPRAVTVEVRERVPVVRKDDADVKIEVGSVDPPWEKWDQEQSLRGGYVWKVALDPGTTKKLSAKYTIKIASKLELVGGNRRES